MKRLAKMFDREQVGVDRWQAVVLSLAAGAVIVAWPIEWALGASGALSPLVVGFLFFFGVCLLLLDLCYVAASMIFTRGNWRQYCLHFVLWLCVYGYFVFLIMRPSLTKALEYQTPWWSR